jgi:hypothetical protein
VGPTEQALADHSHGGAVGFVFGTFGASAASQSTSWSWLGASASWSGSKATLRWGTALPRWAIRREWSMTDALAQVGAAAVVWERLGPA